MTKDLTRREFIAGSALAVAGCATARPRVHYTSPNSRLNVAGIGCGGKGGDDIGACAGENIVALCDVDDKAAKKSFRNWPDAERFRDYRVMLEKRKDIEAVTIGTPDHTHAPAAFMAMELGIHVYVEKPLAHTVQEARILRQAASRCGVVTQMGNQGHSMDGVRRICEVIWTGLLGDVCEVHVWTDRPAGWWPQNIDRPTDTPDVPNSLDWDLWLGTAPYRHYHPAYLPFRWRGWWDFGCCALGDMGCHSMDPVFWAMKLGEADRYSIEAVEFEGGNRETGPAWSVIRYEFPNRGPMPPVTVIWYDGGKKPPAPEGVSPDVLDANGCLFVGSEGTILAGVYGDDPRLLPEEEMKDFVWPDPFIPRVNGGPVGEWINACKGGKSPGSSFDYSGPLTEFVLLGNVALRSGTGIEWDAKRMKVTNDRAANRFVTKKYRKGWNILAV